MTDIAIQKTKEDLASKSLQVTVPADRVKVAEAQAVAKYAKSARLPGFRKGKAPEGLVGKPHIHDLKWSDADVIEFELHVDVHPELKLAKTGGFKVTRTVEPVTDAQVTEQIDKIREQKATWTPIESGKPSPGQLVELSIANLDEG